MFINDYEETVFDETFQITYDDIVEKYELDPQYSIQYLREYLESMYIFQGQDALGRGELKHIRNAAVITALEAALDEIEDGKIVKKLQEVKKPKVDV